MVLSNVFKRRANAGRQQIVSSRAFNFRTVILLAAALTISGYAYANSIPVPYGLVSVNSGPGTVQTVTGSSGTLSLMSSSAGINPDGTRFSAFADAEEYAISSSSLSVYIGGEDQSVPYSPSARATMLYYFNVAAPVGASTPKMVPVRVTYSIATRFTRNEDTLLQVGGFVQLFDTVSGASSLSSICAPAINTVCSSNQVSSMPLVVNQEMFFQSGNLQGVELYAYTGFEATSFVAESSQFNGLVSIDPTFTIDPSFLAQNPGYSLQFSAGIGDTPVGDTPEPASWLMMLVGFAGLGGATYSSRRERRFRPK